MTGNIGPNNGVFSTLLQHPAKQRTMRNWHEPQQRCRNADSPYANLYCFGHLTKYAKRFSSLFNYRILFSHFLIIPRNNMCNNYFAHVVLRYLGTRPATFFVCYITTLVSAIKHLNLPLQNTLNTLLYKELSESLTFRPDLVCREHRNPSVPRRSSQYTSRRSSTDSDKSKNTWAQDS